MPGYNSIYANGYNPYVNQYMSPSYQDRIAQLQNNYQQTVPQAAQPQAQVQTPVINQGLLWVQGMAGAKAYLMAPNSTVLLMDSENERFYIKSTDGTGMPNLRVFEYNELMSNARSEQPSESNQLNMDNFVTREEFDNLRRMNDQIMKRLEEIDLSNKSLDPADDTAREQHSKTQSRQRKGGNVDE